MIDVSELERVYGKLKDVNDNDMTGNDTSKVVDLLEQQVNDLKEQVTELKSGKIKLYEMLTAEQEKSRQFQMMLPSPAETKNKKPVWKRIFRFT